MRISRRQTLRLADDDVLSGGLHHVDGELAELVDFEGAGKARSGISRQRITDDTRELSCSELTACLERGEGKTSTANNWKICASVCRQRGCHHFCESAESFDAALACPVCPLCFKSANFAAIVALPRVSFRMVTS